MRKVFDITILIVTLIALVAIGVAIYFKYFNKNIIIGINYVDNQIAVDVKSADDLTEAEKNELEERWFMNANYFENSKENGIELQELRFDYFMDYNLTQNAYRSTGMQHIGELGRTEIEKIGSASEANEHVDSNFYYYDTTNGITWSGDKLTTRLNRNQLFIIKIDNKPYAIQLIGTYKWITYSYLWWDFAKLVPIKNVNILYYTYLDVFYDVFKAIKSNDYGFGTDLYITLDLSEYFTIREYDLEKGVFKTDDVSDIIKNYAVMKFTYQENGARQSSQSMFNSIEINPKWDIEEKEPVEYWQERVIYNLNYEDLSFRFSDTLGGYFASISLSNKNMFESIPRAKINIVLDLDAVLDNKEMNVIGLDYNGFENFKIYKFEIKSERELEFTLLDKALNNTNIQEFIVSDGITINDAEVHS